MRNPTTAGRAPLKIAFWAGSFERAGTQRFLVELLRRLDRGRFDPIVLSTVKRGDLLPEIESMGIPVHEFGTGRSLLAPKTIRDLTRAALFLRSERVEILSCLLGLTTIVGPYVGRAAGVPVVVNNQRNLNYWLRGRLKEALYGFANRLVVDAVLVNNEPAAAELRTRFSVPASRIVNVGVGIDLDRFGKARANDGLARELGLAGSPVVGMVAKLTPVKGHEFFLAAAQRVAREHEGVRFLVVGDGPLRGRLEETASSLGLDGRIHFVGAREDVDTLLKIMDVFVLSSTSEGSPNVIVEAMAAGVPVVATRVGGVPELVRDGESGILVEPGDVDGLSRAMLALLTDPDLAARMGKLARSLAHERHDIAVVVKTVEDTFTKLLSASRRTRREGGPESADLSFEKVGESGRES
jgi:glycosyltransferase involved in cell wall biosynthesis